MVKIRTINQSRRELKTTQDASPEYAKSSTPRTNVLGYSQPSLRD